MTVETILRQKGADVATIEPNLASCAPSFLMDYPQDGPKRRGAPRSRRRSDRAPSTGAAIAGSATTKRDSSSCSPAPPSPSAASRTSKSALAHDCS